jgi:hypothetical protein
MSDEYQLWRNALANGVTAVNANNPQPGYYKAKRNGKWLPVAIWRQDGALVCRLDKEMVDPIDVWTWCAKTPVAKDDAKAAFETGAWPGDIPATGHNSGTLSLTEEIADVVQTALGWLRKIGSVKDKTESDTAANWRAKLNDLKKKADEQREAEKRPHDEAVNAVQKKWKPAIDEAENAGLTLRDALTAYMRAEEAKAMALARDKFLAEQARVKAERDRIAAEQAALMEKDPIAALTKPSPEPMPELPIFKAPAPIQAGGQRGRKTGLRTVTKYIVTDYAKALDHLKDHPDVRAAVERVAASQAKAGATVPGVEKTEEREAA